MGSGASALSAPGSGSNGGNLSNSVAPGAYHTTSSDGTQFDPSELLYNVSEGITSAYASVGKLVSDIYNKKPNAESTRKSLIRWIEDWLVHENVRDQQDDSENFSTMMLLYNFLLSSGKNISSNSSTNKSNASSASSTSNSAEQQQREHSDFLYRSLMECLNIGNQKLNDPKSNRGSLDDNYYIGDYGGGDDVGDDYLFLHEPEILTEWNTSFAHLALQLIFSPDAATVTRSQTSQHLQNSLHYTSTTAFAANATLCSCITFEIDSTMRQYVATQRNIASALDSNNSGGNTSSSSNSDVISIGFISLSKSLAATDPKALVEVLGGASNTITSTTACRNHFGQVDNSWGVSFSRGNTVVEIWSEGTVVKQLRALESHDRISLYLDMRTPSEECYCLVLLNFEVVFTFRYIPYSSSKLCTIGAQLGSHCSISILPLDLTDVIKKHLEAVQSSSATGSSDVRQSIVAIPEIGYEDERTDTIGGPVAISTAVSSASNHSNTVNKNNKNNNNNREWHINENDYEENEEGDEGKESDHDDDDDAGNDDDDDDDDDADDSTTSDDPWYQGPYRIDHTRINSSSNIPSSSSSFTNGTGTASDANIEPTIVHSMSSASVLQPHRQHSSNSSSTSSGNGSGNGSGSHNRPTRISVNVDATSSILAARRQGPAGEVGAALGANGFGPSGPTPVPSTFPQNNSSSSSSTTSGSGGGGRGMLCISAPTAAAVVTVSATATRPFTSSGAVYTPNASVTSRGSGGGGGGGPSSPAPPLSARGPGAVPPSTARPNTSTSAGSIVALANRSRNHNNNTNNNSSFRGNIYANSPPALPAGAQIRTNSINGSNNNISSNSNSRPESRNSSSHSSPAPIRDQRENQINTSVTTATATASVSLVGMDNNTASNRSSYSTLAGLTSERESRTNRAGGEIAGDNSIMRSNNGSSTGSVLNDAMSASRLDSRGALGGGGDGRGSGSSSSSSSSSSSTRAMSINSSGGGSGSGRTSGSMSMDNGNINVPTSTSNAHESNIATTAHSATSSSSSDTAHAVTGALTPRTVQRQQDERLMQFRLGTSVVDSPPPRATLAAPALTSSAPPAMALLERSSASSKSSAAQAEDEDESKLCCVCLDAPKCVVLLPCKHLCVCEGCSDSKGSLQNCPMCRVKIFQRMKVFL